MNFPPSFRLRSELGFKRSLLLPAPTRSLSGFLFFFLKKKRGEVILFVFCRGKSRLRAPGRAKHRTRPALAGTGQGKQKSSSLPLLFFSPPLPFSPSEAWEISPNFKLWGGKDSGLRVLRAGRPRRALVVSPRSCIISSSPREPNLLSNHNNRPLGSRKTTLF